MGNKRITEKDFWICTNGAVPAQLQSGNTSTKKISGEKYITIQDKATSSWIDFGCTKLMLIYALLAAAIVVVGAMIIGTGGAALIAIGAIAGLAGAAWGAVVGTMLCGHQGAKIRDWIPVPKSQRTYVQGVEQLTGDYQMTCKIPGGMITFAPQIKSWSQAISLGASNYLGKLMEGMMAGAAIGMGGAAISGGAAAFSAGGARGLAQGAWQFARSMPKNFYVNAIESVSKFGLALRGVMGVQNTAATYGNTGEASGWDFVKGTVAMETGAYDSFQNIRTGKGTWQDYVGMAMMFAPVGQGKRDLEASLRNEPEGTARDIETSKVDETETTTRDEEGSTRAEAQDGAKSNEGEIGDAYEQSNLTPEELATLVASRRQTAIEFYQKYYPELPIWKIESHISGIDFKKPVSVVKIPEGTELIQYTKVNSEGTPLRGDYYTTDPNATPNELGVSDKYNVQTPDRVKTQEVREVTKETIKTTKDVEGLSSTSAEINDTWSRIDAGGNELPVHTDGGGSQIYIPKTQF